MMRSGNHHPVCGGWGSKPAWDHGECVTSCFIIIRVIPGTRFPSLALSFYGPRREEKESRRKAKRGLVNRTGIQITFK